MQGFPELTKPCSHFYQILPITADVKSRLYIGKNWLLGPGTRLVKQMANVWHREPLKCGMFV